MELREKQERIKLLVSKVADGDDYSFEELESVAKPLLVSLSSNFSSLHSKFEFEDMYAICMEALYSACLSFNPENPCFLSYAKKVMSKSCLRELEYWNYAKRNVFDNTEVSFEISNPLLIDSDGTPDILITEGEFEKEFRCDIENILEDSFDTKKAEVLRLHILGNKRVSEVAKELGLKYKNTHSIIRRGLPKLQSEYELRFLDKYREL